MRTEAAAAAAAAAAETTRRLPLQRDLRRSENAKDRPSPLDDSTEVWNICVAVGLTLRPLPGLVFYSSSRGRCRGADSGLRGRLSAAFAAQGTRRLHGRRSFDESERDAGVRRGERRARIAGGLRGHSSGAGGRSGKLQHFQVTEKRGRIVYVVVVYNLIETSRTW